MSKEVFAQWEGEFQFKMISAVIYPSIEATGLDSNEFTLDIELYRQGGEKYILMVVELKATNIDAQSAYNEGNFYTSLYAMSSQEEFALDRFNKCDGETWHLASEMPLAYYSSTSDGKHNSSYFLKPGETANLVLCFFVKIDQPPRKDLIIEIITNSMDHRFGIELNDVKEVKG